MVYVVASKSSWLVLLITVGCLFDVRSCVGNGLVLIITAAGVQKVIKKRSVGNF